MNTFERLSKIAADAANVPEAQITPYSRLGRDLGMDSLAFVEFIMSLEDDWELEIPDESGPQLPSMWQDVTIQDVVNWIEGIE